MKVYLRTVKDDGSRPYLKAVELGNNKGFRDRFAFTSAAKQSTSQVAPTNLRFARAGKRVWEYVGSDASLVPRALRERIRELEDIADGSAKPRATPPVAVWLTLVSPRAGGFCCVPLGVGLRIVA